MNRRILQPAAVLVFLAATACAEYPLGSVGPASLTLHSDGGVMSLASLQSRAVSGLVLAPASVVAAGGGNVVAAGGGNVIAAGGGNFAVLALRDETPVAGAQVHLADLQGRPLSGPATVATDASGRYTISNVPADMPYVVVARFRTPAGPTATLNAMGHSSCAAEPIAITVATTLVTTAFVRSGNSPASFSPAAFEAAARAVGESLTEATMPDLTRPSDVAEKAEAIAAAPAVREALEHLKTVPPPQSTGPETSSAAPAVPAAPAASGTSRRRSSGDAAPPTPPAVEPDTAPTDTTSPDAGDEAPLEAPPQATAPLDTEASAPDAPPQGEAPASGAEQSQPVAGDPTPPAADANAGGDGNQGNGGNSTGSNGNHFGQDKDKDKGANGNNGQDKHKKKNK